MRSEQHRHGQKNGQDRNLIILASLLTAILLSNVLVMVILNGNFAQDAAAAGVAYAVKKKT